jgi:hypothetical protein
MEDGTRDSAGCGCVGVPYILGMCIAVVVSWEQYHSILWSSIDGIFSWGFIIYHFIVAPALV